MNRDVRGIVQALLEGLAKLGERGLARILESLVLGKLARCNRGNVWKNRSC